MTWHRNTHRMRITMEKTKWARRKESFLNECSLFTIYYNNIFINNIFKIIYGGFCYEILYWMAIKYVRTVKKNC